jgi:hypothetical protein
VRVFTNAAGHISSLVSSRLVPSHFDQSALLLL